MAQDFGSLFARLEAGDCTLKRTDFEQLSDLSRAALTSFCEGWDAVSVKARRSVIAALAQMAQDNYEYSFERVFRQALDDADAVVRATAIQGLWESEDASLVGPLIRLLESDTDELVRAAAASGLGQYVYLGEVEEIEAAVEMAVETALLRTIHNQGESIEVQRRAIEAISFSCNPEVSDLIQDAYEHEDPRMRASALFGMGRSANRRWSKIVLHELSSTDQLMRFEAVRASGELELREAVNALERVIAQDADPDTRLAAVRSLGQTGGNKARQILRRIIASGDPEFVETAQDALEEWSFIADSPEISELLWGRGSSEVIEADDFHDEWEDEDLVGGERDVDDDVEYADEDHFQDDDDDDDDEDEIGYRAWSRWASAEADDGSEALSGLFDDLLDDEDAEEVYDEDEDDE